MGESFELLYNKNVQEWIGIGSVPLNEKYYTHQIWWTDDKRVIIPTAQGVILQEEVLERETREGKSRGI